MRPASVIDHLEVSRDEAGRLRVTWKVVGDCDQVDVAFGLSADGLDHARALTLPAGDGEAVIDPGRSVRRGRVYVSIAPAASTKSTTVPPGVTPGPGATVAAERRVGLNGPVNFRDLGGYKSTDGRRVRWGRLFRSDALVLDDQDRQDLVGLGIRTVYDLRSDVERAATPNRLPDEAPPGVVALPLVSEKPEANPLAAIDSTDGEDFLAHLYRHILEHSAANFGAVLTGLSEADHLPAVFHCAAGKDRTGMVAAVVLSILGVPLDDILDDYELTSRYRTTEHVQASMRRLEEHQNLPPEVIAGMLRAPRWAMHRALTDVAQRNGGFDGYVTGPAGAPAGVPDRLRQLLLTD
jgi:protein-tyrosine phosphatase